MIFTIIAVQTFVTMSDPKAVLYLYQSVQKNLVRVTDLDYTDSYSDVAGIVTRNMSMVVNQTMILVVIVFITEKAGLSDFVRVDPTGNPILGQHCSDRPNVLVLVVRFMELLKKEN